MMPQLNAVLNLQDWDQELLLVMQVDFETPRKAQSAAWKGLINQPDIDGVTNINKGLEYAGARDGDMDDATGRIAAGRCMRCMDWL